MNKFLISLALLFSFNIKAIECGINQISGEVQANNDGELEVVIAKGTKSEIILSTPKERSLKFLAYKNKSFLGKFEISKIIAPQKAVIKKIVSMESIVSEPLNNSWSKIELIKKMECEK